LGVLLVEIIMQSITLKIETVESDEDKIRNEMSQQEEKKALKINDNFDRYAKRRERISKVLDNR
jgi:hypothetical protein